VTSTDTRSLLFRGTEIVGLKPDSASAGRGILEASAVVLADECASAALVMFVR
jgi:hypothetical protein